MAVSQKKIEPRRAPTLVMLTNTRKKVLSSRVATVGLIIICFWILVSIFAPFLTPYGPNDQHITAVNEGPSFKHLLGTDDLGRDIMTRLFYAGRIALLLAPASVLCALIVGSFLGLIAGYYGGWVDEIAMRIIDAMMGFPAILLYLIIISAIGPSASNVMLAITITGAPGIAKLVRGLAMDIRTREYVSAARLRGESSFYIMVVEILLNARGPVIVDAMLRVGYAIIAIGTLGFLGLGLPPPTPDWGGMVSRGRSFIWMNPWPVLWPTIAISSFVIGLNMFVDGIREDVGGIS